MKIKNIENKLFLIVFLLILVLGFSTLFRSQKKMSKDENRNLNQFPKFTINGFVNAKFQDDFSLALEDQFLLGGTIKKKMNKYTNFVNYSNVSKRICKNHYIKVDDNYQIFNCERIVYTPVNYYEQKEKNLINTLDKLQQQFGDKFYLYYINDSYNHNFETGENTYNIDSIFKNYNYSYLDFKDYNEFSNYFYKTDHHWSYLGSRKGYEGIASLLKFEPKDPIGTYKFDFKYYGSMARMTKIDDFYDNFTVYQYKDTPHKVIINGNEKRYGDTVQNYSQKYSKEQLTNHYAYFYGGDYGEVIYEYSNSEKENLLIISNSFSNAINKEIASHFKKIYIIDLRHYKNAFKKDFDYKEYVKENKIDKILILGNYNLFFSEFLQTGAVIPSGI